jgi:hypothetical protein
MTDRTPLTGKCFDLSMAAKAAQKGVVRDAPPEIASRMAFTCVTKDPIKNMLGLRVIVCQTDYTLEIMWRAADIVRLTAEGVIRRTYVRLVRDHGKSHETTVDRFAGDSADFFDGRCAEMLGKVEARPSKAATAKPDAPHVEAHAGDEGLAMTAAELDKAFPLPPVWLVTSDDVRETARDKPVGAPDWHLVYDVDID